MGKAAKQNGDKGLLNVQPTWMLTRQTRQLTNQITFFANSCSFFMLHYTCNQTKALPLKVSVWPTLSIPCKHLYYRLSHWASFRGGGNGLGVSRCVCSQYRTVNIKNRPNFACCNNIWSITYRIAGNFAGFSGNSMHFYYVLITVSNSISYPKSAKLFHIAKFRLNQRTTLGSAALCTRAQVCVGGNGASSCGEHSYVHHLDVHPVP